MASDPNMVDANTPLLKLYKDDDDGPQDRIPDIDDADPDTYDQYVGAEVELSQWDRVMTGKVKRRKLNPDRLVHIQHGTNRLLRKTTKGWKLCIECKDGTTDR